MPVSIILPKNGDGFLLQSFTRKDVEQLAEIEFDSEVKQFLALPKRGKPQWIKEFNPDSYGGWAIVVRNTLAGRASILRCKRRGDCELAIVIGRPFWGMNLGRKVAAMLIQSAFDELQAKALVAIVHPNHDASIALLRALKFRHRGVVASSQHGQIGHFIYRMSRGTYNLSFQGTQRDEDAHRP